MPPLGSESAQCLTLADDVGEDRILAIPGGFNFRDFGGYETVDGRRVRRRVLYRSGTMTHLTPEGRASLARLGMASIIDLRTPRERSHEPTDWHLDHDVDYWCRDYTHTSGDLAETLEQAEFDAADVRAVMVNVYRAIPFEHAASYRALFARLLAGSVPLVVNCAAGKDRTGVAVALVLSALGVPRPLIEADYMLTRRADFDWLMSKTGGKLAARPRDAIAPLLAVEMDYLDAMFDAVETRHGSMVAYLEAEIGLGGEKIDQLRESLLHG